ncbi:hypothetical protein BC830DRAFT_41351 [Chytriomyces sp. MP71]|nr:hypothetical protein BC830DRAFT_41351 [Chytriomyces sp. MP71]
MATTFDDLKNGELMGAEFCCGKEQHHSIRIPCLELSCMRVLYWRLTLRPCLCAALTQNLESRGVLGSIKAKLRAEIFKSLHEEVELPQNAFETNVLNELILEYLEFHGLKHTTSVFTAEACIKKPLISRTRTEVGADLHIDDRAFPPDIPLLYGLCFKNLPPDPRTDRVMEPSARLNDPGFQSDVHVEERRGRAVVAPIPDRLGPATSVRAAEDVHVGNQWPDWMISG